MKRDSKILIAVSIISFVAISSLLVVKASLLKEPIEIAPGESITISSAEPAPELGGSSSNTFTLCGFTATTSPAYFVAGTTASSSCIAMIADTDSVDLAWFLNASSTSSQIGITPYYSDDDDPATQNWYAGRTYTVAANGLVNYSTNPQYEVVSVNSSGDNYVITELTGLNNRWLKIEYNIIGANGGATLNIIGKN